MANRNGRRGTSKNEEPSPHAVPPRPGGCGLDHGCVAGRRTDRRRAGADRCARDMSGPYADNTGPGLVLAAQMAVEDFGGQVLGRPLRVEFADDQNKPDVGLGIARRWLAEDGVQAVVGGSASSITLAVSDLARARGRILLIAASGSTDLTGKACTPVSFQFGFDTYALPKAVVESPCAGD